MNTFEFTVDGVRYSVNDDNTTVTVAGYPSDSEPTGDLTIPESVTFRGCPYRVTSIGVEAFDECSGLTSVTIPNSVTSIGEGAFASCSGLTSVTIPNSVISIGKGAFYECSGLTSVIIGNSVTEIGYEAFRDCTGLTSVVWNAKNCIYFTSVQFRHLTNIKTFEFGSEVEKIPAYLCNGLTGLTSVTIPNSVTEIGEGAFSGCSGLTSVTIPNSVTSISWYAFYECSGLTSVTIPNSVTSIGDWAFSHCSGLTRIDAYPNPEKVRTGGGAFYGVPKDGALHVLPKYLSAYRTASQWKDFTNIKGDLTEIGGFEFTVDGVRYSVNDDNTTVKVVGYPSGSKPTGDLTIPGSVTYGGISYPVTKLGVNAFRSCTGLTSVIIGNSVTSIGQGAFYDCNGLTSVTIPNSVTSIGDDAFSDCRGLKSVTIPNSVTSIGGSAFYGCNGLTSVTIPNSVTSIGGSAFYDCI